jgi:hypothetical protein
MQWYGILAPLLTATHILNSELYLLSRSEYCHLLLTKNRFFFIKGLYICAETESNKMLEKLYLFYVVENIGLCL